ncbi:MAG TPA: hypothetical protein VN554_03155 [Verrucomicrobiae bacterium]|nr:hypothetical protein [Verrucomicrobiae bacterium]
MSTTGEVPKPNPNEAREALERDIERHAAIARQAYDTTLLPGEFMTSIEHHPEAQVGWYEDDDDPRLSYKIAVGTAPGWRHTTLLRRIAIEGRTTPLEQEIAYLIHDDDHNTVLFRGGDGDIEIEAHSGVIVPPNLCHSGIPSTALESFRDTGPETLAEIERVVGFVHRGERATQEHQKRLAALSYPSDI